MSSEQDPSEVKTRAELIACVRALAQQAPSAESGFENRDLESYLEALAAWLEDMDGYFEGRGETPPKEMSWRLLAQALTAATIYE